ncbi:MAG: hypothetical protein KAU83_03690, partial [Bacteroidales bacterium]|nr:hypothetical protein [Bacteroidales bacterium]
NPDRVRNPVGVFCLPKIPSGLIIEGVGAVRPLKAVRRMCGSICCGARPLFLISFWFSSPKSANYL